MKWQKIEKIRIVFKGKSSLNPAAENFIRPGFFSALVFILCLSLIVNSPLSAQIPGQGNNNIRGNIRDVDTGEALPGANVALKGTKLGAATNVEGYFVILSVPAEICTLQVSYIGYTTKDVVVDNTTPGQELLNIEIKAVAFMSEEVVVTAQARVIDVVRDKVSQIKISPAQLQTLPNFGEVDVFRSLQLLPGISAADDGSSGLYVRGGTPDQNLILFDGMKIYHVDHFFGFFSAFNADAIKDIKMYKGGFPAEYGGRISSVVDITGKTGNANNKSFAFGANLLSANAVFEVPVSEKVNFLISTRRSYTDFIKSSLYNNIYGFMTGDDDKNTNTGNFKMRQGRRGANFMQGTENPDFYFFDLNSKVTWTPTAKDILTVSFYTGKDNLDQSQDFGGVRFRFSDEEPENSMTMNNVTEWGNLGISGKWSRQWNDRIYTNFQIATSEYFSKYDRNRMVNSDLAPNDSTSVARGLVGASEEDNKVGDMTIRFDNELQVTNSHKIKIGGEFAQFRTEYTSTFNDTINMFSRETEAMQRAVYIQDKWDLFNTLELTLGVRANYYDMTDTDYIEPRMSFVYKLTNKINIKGAWGEYNQFVSRIANENVLEGSRDFWLLADEELLPMYAEHQVLGFSYENDDYLFDIEAYNKDLDNIVEYTRRIRRKNENADSPFFLGSGTSQGIEFLLQKKRGKITGWAGYTLGEVEYVFPDLNSGDPFPADHDRRHEFKMVGTYSWSRWKFSGTWVYASGRAYTSPESQYYLTMLDDNSTSYIHVSDKNSNRLTPYHRLDLSASRRFETERIAFDFGLSIFNAYNHENVYYKKYELDTTPIVITDVLMLGFTPTLSLKLHIK